MVTLMTVVTFYFDTALDLGMGAALVYEQEEGSPAGCTSPSPPTSPSRWCSASLAVPRRPADRRRCSTSRSYVGRVPVASGR